MRIGRYDVMNTSGKNGARDRVTVKLAGEVLARVEFSKRNPLGYLRMHPASEHRSRFSEMLRSSGVPEEDIEMILRKPDPNEAKPRRGAPIEQGQVPRDMIAQAWFSLTPSAHRSDNDEDET